MNKPLSDRIVILVVFLCALAIVVFAAWGAQADPVTGTWPRADGTTGTARCPDLAQQADAANVVRLPVGCLVLSPRLGYTIAQDLHARDELGVLRATVPALQIELRQTREHADEILTDSLATLRSRDETLEKERDRGAGFQTQLATSQAETSAVRSQRNWWTLYSGGICLLVGGLVGALVTVVVTD